ncbi:MAG: phage holin family protein [Clostridia bacterium]|nr:phage holin family protein [Clostridia bacterium]
MILRWILNSVALLITAYVIEGIYISGFIAALGASLVLGVVNAVIRSLFLLFTLPLNIFTLCLFTFVINGVMLKLAAVFVPGFQVHGVLSAIVGSIILSIISFFLTTITDD